MSIQLVEFKKSGYVRSYEKHQQRSDMPDAPSRIFISFNETVAEHLANRRTRPYTQMKPIIAEVLENEGINFTKIRWNRYAGCDVCPCSGGFIIEGNYGQDYYAKFDYVSTEVLEVA